MLPDFIFPDKFSPLWYSDKTYFLLSGGRGAGKSYSMAGYVISKLVAPEQFKCIIARYTLKSVDDSVFGDIVSILTKFKLISAFNVTKDSISFGNNTVKTHGMKLQEGSMVAHGKGFSEPTHLIIDEAQEVTQESEYQSLIDSFRTKDAKTQIIIIYNPTDKSSWIYKRWYLTEGVLRPLWDDSHVLIHMTYKDNLNNLNKDKIKEWDDAEATRPDYYKTDILGTWKEIAEGRIYTGWQVQTEDYSKEKEVFGLDFGFSNEPAACIGVTKEHNKLILREILYMKGLTNKDLYSILISRGLNNRSVIVADCASPKDIQDLKDMGFANIRPCAKGQGSIQNGIKKIKEFEIYATADSANLWYEYENYIFVGGMPKDKDNHLLDPLRYTQSVETVVSPANVFSLKDYEKMKELKSGNKRYMGQQ